MMGDCALSLYVERYKSFVKNNPLIASELEVALRWISYFAAGRFSQSVVVSELMHSASNLLTLVNDSILRKAAKLPVHLNSAIEKLQTVLSVIEYIEVFAEVAARRIGPRSRWFVIISLQIVKTVIRLLLFLKYKHGIHISPPIPPLNRRVDVPQFCFPDSRNEDSSEHNSSNVEFTFTLKRSGRIIRTLEAAPPLTGRTWKVPDSEKNSKSRSIPPTQLHGKHLVAEILHIYRPLTHLATMYLCGEFSWKPWMISVIMDLISLRLLQNNNKLSYSERLELSRRTLLLLLYIIRSPFYDKFSRNHILYMLSSLSDVRLLGHLIRPMIEYLPEWQRTYFYMWTL